MALTTALAESVPVWIVAGSIAVSGWAFERATSQTAETNAIHSKHATQLELLQLSTSRDREDILEIKAGVKRVENLLLEERSRG